MRMRAKGERMGIIIPLYTYPTDATWLTVGQQAALNPAAHLTVIINPNNGAGFSRDPQYVTGAMRLKAAGCTVLGYVATSYGSRPMSSIIAECELYASWYQTDGIFFDELSSGWMAPPVTGLRLGNPGTEATSNIPLVTYESAGMPPANLTGNYIAHSVAMLPLYYPKPTYYYITDDRATYQVLPSYFSALVAGDALGQTVAPPQPVLKKLTLTTPFGVYSWNVD